MARSRSTTPPARPTSSPTLSAGTGRNKLFPIYGEVPAEGGGWGRRGQTLPHLWGSTRRRRGMGPTWTNSSPFMGKYPPKAGDGADADKLFPIYGEVPAEGGGWGRRGQTLPHLWGSTRRRRGMGPTWVPASFTGGSSWPD